MFALGGAWYVRTYICARMYCKGVAKFVTTTLNFSYHHMPRCRSCTLPHPLRFVTDTFEGLPAPSNRYAHYVRSVCVESFSVSKMRFAKSAIINNSLVVFAQSKPAYRTCILSTAIPDALIFLWRDDAMLPSRKYRASICSKIVSNSLLVHIRSLTGGSVFSGLLAAF